MRLPKKWAISIKVKWKFGFSVLSHRFCKGEYTGVVKQGSSTLNFLGESPKITLRFSFDMIFLGCSGVKKIGGAYNYKSLSYDEN